jgi:hypothetical protein
MKPGKLLYIGLVGFIAFAFGIVGSWFVLTGNWASPYENPQYTMGTKFIAVGALWLAVFVAIIGLYSGGKDAKWELPTYENFDKHVMAIDEALRQQKATAKDEKPIVEQTAPASESVETTPAAVQALERPKVELQQTKPDDKDWDYSYRGEYPKRKRSEYEK